MPDYFESGLCVRKPSWHGKENLLEVPPESMEEARRLAGLEWEPEEIPVYVKSEDGAAYQELEEFKALRRSDSGKVLHVARDSYEIITNLETFEIVYAVMKNGAYLDTAGSVREGRQVWALAHLDEPIIIPGDRSLVFPYIVMLTSHDGSAACKVLPTAVRVVCWNTFQMASSQGDATGVQFIFRHTKRVKDRIEEAKSAIAGVRNFAERWREENLALATLQISEAGVRQFVQDFIPDPPAHMLHKMTERQVDNLKLARATLEWIITSAPTTEGIRGTAYGLVQAAGEYMDHYKGHNSSESYISRTLLRPEPMKAKALKLARQAATV